MKGNERKDRKKREKKDRKAKKKKENWILLTSKVFF